MLWEEICNFVKEAVNQIGQIFNTVAPVYAGMGAGILTDGPAPFADIAMLIGAAALTIGVIGYGTYQATKSISTPKSTTKEKAKDIAPLLPKDIVIYRYGGTNPGNLTPKAKDKFSGLSFSTIPMPGAAKTTIGALNATGIVYAVKDGPTHISVRPVGVTMDDWINEGSTSIWTMAVKSVVVKWDGN